jgi:cytochrome c5
VSAPRWSSTAGTWARRAAALLFLLTVPLAAQELPAGPGRDLVVKRCVACHEADLITQQRLTRAGWGRSLDKMVRWGAVVETEEREPMLDYLSARFAVKPASGHIVATAGNEAVYKRACLTCHEDDIIESQRLSRAGWLRSIDKMIRWGANVPAEEKDGLIDYLAARYPPR